MAASRDPSLTEVLDVVLERRLADVHTAMPGRVEAYDAETQTVDVQPLVKVPFEAEDGTTQWESLPVLPNVPLGFLRGGQFRITAPVAVGDVVELLFNEVSIDLWQAGQPGVHNPQDPRRHHLSDAVAIVGLHSNQAAFTDAPADALTFGHDTGPQLRAKAAVLELGSNAAAPVTDGVLLGSTYRTEESTALAALKAALDSIALMLPLLNAALAGTSAAATVSNPAAGPAIVAAGVALVSAQTAVTSAAAALSAFDARKASHVSNVVKTR